MKRKVERVVIDGEIKYRVYQKKNIFSKWDHIVFIDEDNGNQYPEFTAEQMFKIGSDFWTEIDKDIRNELWDKHLEKEIKEHCENVYRIEKWDDPEHTRITKTLCGAKEIGDLSDGYHTFNDLYDFRREYNAALVNTGVWKSHKSHRHHDGELCFGGGWFIVMMETPFGQISNHYEDKYWDEFHCEEKETADEWDGHTDKDVLERLTKCNTK